VNEYVLLGAGVTGRAITRQLVAKGTPPVCFADNDQKKWGTEIEGVVVLSPKDAIREYPEATWVATAQRPPFHAELEAQIAEMGVRSVPLHDFLPAHRDLPPFEAERTIVNLIRHNEESFLEWFDQMHFRRDPTHTQRPPRHISNVYWEDFFTRRDDEHFVDCGANDGDTIRDFKSRWKKWNLISAFEPDRENFIKLQESENGAIGYTGDYAAVSDFKGEMSFVQTGDQTAHLGGGGTRVPVVKLDSMELDPPTFIKMDIEGSELEGLWGAREIIKKHSPVLAICAYHFGDHIWQIPLLIHALNPKYKLYLRRYLPETWELIWYAVPPERVK
jgi:FkbM family methyltransferase